MSNSSNFHKYFFDALKYGLKKESNTLLRVYTASWFIWALIIIFLLITDPPRDSYSDIDNFITSLFIFLVFIVLPYTPIYWIWNKQNNNERSLDNAPTELLSKSKMGILGIAHIIVLIFAIFFIDDLSYYYYDVSDTDMLITVLIFVLIITTSIVYDIFKNGKLLKKLSYINTILLIISCSLLEYEPDLSILTGIMAIPSLVNIILIKKYSEHPTKGSRNHEQIFDYKSPHSEEILDSKPIISPVPEPDNTTPLNQENENRFENTFIQETTNNAIGIRTAFSYKGATIQYKVRVENPTPEPIADIKVILYVPDVFLLSASNKNIGMLKPDEGKTVTFDIRPTGECGDCEISGKVVYYDYFAKKTSETEIPVKSLSIVCPILHGREINENEWHGSVSNLIKAEESTRDIDMSAESLFTMLSRIIKDMHMYAINPEIMQNEQLFNGVARFYGEGVKGLRYAAEIEVIGGSKKSKLILKTWAEKEEALTGFYHGVLDEIEKRVNVKEYIDNSIAQQYNIHYGDKIGAQVKDSLVQRSNIGSNTKRKCPDCGKETVDNDKFCNECGAKLE